MSFFCSISGEPPQDPVVSSKSGHVYERRLILKYINENGTDPITGDKLEEADLVTVKASAYSCLCFMRPLLSYQVVLTKHNTVQTQKPPRHGHQMLARSLLSSRPSKMSGTRPCSRRSHSGSNTTLFVRSLVMLSTRRTRRNASWRVSSRSVTRHESEYNDEMLQPYLSDNVSAEHSAALQLR